MNDFKNLRVYQKAKNLNSKVYELLKSNKRIDKYIENQLKRASISVVTNIAEGTGKLSYKDQNNFYTIARASVFECVSLLEILIDLKVASEEETSSLILEFEDTSKMLYGMRKNNRKRTSKRSTVNRKRSTVNSKR